MPTVLIVPGLNGSGPEHWQTYWEHEIPGAVRVVQADWDRPRRAPWVAALVAAVDAHPGAFIVAHSLGGPTVAWAVEDRLLRDVSGAMLVAPPDVDDIGRIEDPLRDFTPMPLSRFPFPTVLVASQNDPYSTITRARFFARRWGAEFVNVGDEGHINADSGLGDWPEGKAILARLMGGEVETA
ncbi:RBBP9/YdeN family alpha/beta hydrolase [Bauldia sp.]|uniref:RBBP9/YdeN family alpha/beta hydrolase n=1 Tax=Bauldia sp. TaxID=2575872 RepID=UPI003BAB5E7B